MTALCCDIFARTGKALNSHHQPGAAMLNDVFRSRLCMGGVTTLFEGSLKRATEKKGITCRTKKDNEILSTQDAVVFVYDLISVFVHFSL